MIELSDTEIREIEHQDGHEDGTFIATTTFTVETPVPGTFTIDVPGKTIIEAIDNLVDYIREHSDDDESILLGIKTMISGLLEESAEILRLRDISYSVDVVNVDDLLPNQDFADWSNGEKYNPKNWTITPDEQ